MQIQHQTLERQREIHIKAQQNGTSIFKEELDKDKSAASSWGVNMHRGGVTSTGVGGSATGKAHIAIIDDPF